MGGPDMSDESDSSDGDFLSIDENGFKIVDWSDVDTDDDGVELEKPSHSHPPTRPDGYMHPGVEEITFSFEVGEMIADEKRDTTLYEPEPPFVCAVCKQMIDPDGDMVIDGSRKEVRHDGCDKLK
jgi:hypothetical protein